MRHRVLAAAALLLSAALAACSGNPAASIRGPEVDLAFGIQRLQNEPAFVVTGGVGEVTIRGYFRAPCTPYEARAETDLATGTLTVRLLGQQPRACRDAVVNLGYQADVRALAAGEYRLHVIHTLPATSWPAEMVVDTQVTVR
ncbi:MAG: hypothetical protein KY467_16085 [Gemmatimonadetes bacterium]|nr:hypothetical protein [Gemmatimonadota bacterium]